MAVAMKADAEKVLKEMEAEAEAKVRRGGGVWGVWGGADPKAEEATGVSEPWCWPQAG